MTSYGVELELSDVDRSIDIPEILGSWEGPKLDGYYMGAEIDIVNTIGENRGLSADPLCKTCTVGGEINVHPTTDIESQCKNIEDILNLFSIKSTCHTSHLHIHTYNPLFEDFKTLQNIFLYTAINQVDFVNKVYLSENYDTVDAEAIEYVIADGGKFVDLSINDIYEAKTIADLKKLLNKPAYYYIDGYKIQTKSNRTGINLYNLVNNKTIEFRCFRSTTDLNEIYSCLSAVECFISEAMKFGKSVDNTISKLKFPKLQWDDDIHKGWMQRHDKSRGDKYKYWQNTFKNPYSRIK